PGPSQDAMTIPPVGGSASGGRVAVTGSGVGTAVGSGVGGSVGSGVGSTAATGVDCSPSTTSALETSRTRSGAVPGISVAAVVSTPATAIGRTAFAVVGARKETKDAKTNTNAPAQ